MIRDTSVFARHLDLTPLRGRRAGLVRCRFHAPDQHPSLSIDLDRGLFHCHTCGAQGGVTSFAELVGERPTSPRLHPHPETELDRARREIVAQARVADERAVSWAPWHLANAAVRRYFRAADQARRLVMDHLGPDHSRTWPLLEQAADVERQGCIAEGELDALLEDGRLHLDTRDDVEPIMARCMGRRP
jgi:hypothetical protein